MTLLRQHDDDDDSKIEEIVVLGALGGSVSHEFAVLNSLYRYSTMQYSLMRLKRATTTTTTTMNNDNAPMVLISDENIILMIDGCSSSSLKSSNVFVKTELSVSRVGGGGVENVRCSLIPLGQTVVNITTKGLKWNLS